MKLPQSQGMGVQSLGRDDINAPARAWQTKTQANSAMANALKEVSGQFLKVANAQKEVEDSLLYQQQLDADMKQNIRLKSYMTTKPVIEETDPDIPDELLQYFKENKVTFVDGKINTSDVMDGFFTTHFKTQQNNGMEALKKTKYRDDYIASMRPQTAQIYGEASYAGVKYKQEQLRADAATIYDQAVNDGDEKKALAQIEQNTNETRIWTPEEGSKALAELGGRIDFGNYSKTLQSDSPAVLEDLQDEIWNNPNRLTTAQKTQLSNAAESKLNAQNAKAVADEKARVETQSKTYQNELLADISENGPMNWDRLQSKLGGMLPDDATAVITLNRTMASGRAGMSSKAAFNSLSLDVLSLSTLDPSIDPKDARLTVRKAIYEAADRNEITGTDALKLIQEADKAETLPFKTQEYKAAEDRIYTTIVGATKEAPIFSSLENSAESKLAASFMERDLQNAMRSGGEGFDVEGWVESNIWRYVKDTYYTNISNLSEGVGVFALIETTSVSGTQAIDLEATRAKIKDAVRLGSIQPKSANEAIAYAEALYSQQQYSIKANAQ